jgi:hypothetical protein
LDRIYRASGYAYLADYSQPPVPPLSAADAEWAQEQLRKWRAA